jgi:hypothetical protein
MAPIRHVDSVPGMIDFVESERNREAEPRQRLGETTRRGGFRYCEGKRQQAEYADDDLNDLNMPPILSFDLSQGGAALSWRVLGS